MTLTSMLADLYRRFNYQSNPATEVTTRLTAFLNEAQRDIIGEPGFASMLRATITFASVADRAEYQLPPVIAQILSIRDTASRRTLERVSEEWYRRYISDPASDTGLPWAYAPIGLRSGTARPSDASELFAKSTAAGDTQVLHYEVVTSEGNTRTGTVTLNGTTAVSLSASITSIVEVSDLYLASAAVGTVTIHEDSGVGTQLGQINIGNTREQRWIIALVPTPSSVLTYTADAERNLTDLVQGTDEPQLPSRFHAAVLYGARMKEADFKDDLQRYSTAKAAYDDILGQMRAFLAGYGSIVPGGTPVGISSLGAQFPADMWVR